jgi:L-rhamnonate dehydratase
MKITDVEAIYVRQPDVKARADSGQDAVLIKVYTDEGITGTAKSIRRRWR